MAEILDAETWEAALDDDAETSQTCGNCGLPLAVVDPEMRDGDYCSSECKKERQNKMRRKTASGINRQARQMKVQQTLGFIGLSVSAIDPICGSAALEQAEEIADALEEMATENESVDKTLALLTKGGGFVQLATAMLPLLKTVYSHHMTSRYDDQPSTNGDGETGGEPPPVTPLVVAREGVKDDE